MKPPLMRIVTGKTEQEIPAQDKYIQVIRLRNHKLSARRLEVKSML